MATGTADKPNQDAGKTQAETPPGSGTGLEKGKEGGAEPEKTYRQSEVDAMLGKAGQRIQTKLETITTERDTLKSQVGNLTTEITEAKGKITSLTKDIEVMSEDDPDKQGLVLRRKELEIELGNLKVQKAGIEESRTEIAQWKRDQLVYTVADEFVTADGGSVDLNSFKNTADKFKLSGREELETLAETLGLKPKSEVSETPPPTVYSGLTEGGSDRLGDMSPKDQLAELEKRQRGK